jgi:hypothetical protein
MSNTLPVPQPTPPAPLPPQDDVTLIPVSLALARLLGRQLSAFGNTLASGDAR